MPRPLCVPGYPPHMTQTFRDILVEVGRLRDAFDRVNVAALAGTGALRQTIAAARAAAELARRRELAGDHDCVFTLHSRDCEVCGQPIPLEVRAHRLNAADDLGVGHAGFRRGAVARRRDLVGGTSLPPLLECCARSRCFADDTVDDTLAEAAAWETIWTEGAHRNTAPEPGPLIGPTEQAGV
jgi:hypothetical protein